MIAQYDKVSDSIKPPLNQTKFSTKIFCAIYFGAIAHEFNLMSNV